MWFFCFALCPVRPRCDKRYKRNHCPRGSGLGAKSLWKGIEVAQGFEGKVLLLDLRAQTAEKIADPSREVWIRTKRYVHAHSWCMEPRILKDPVEREPYIGVCPRALQGFLDQRNACKPKG